MLKKQILFLCLFSLFSISFIFASGEAEEEAVHSANPGEIYFSDGDTIRCEKIYGIKASDGNSHYALDFTYNKTSRDLPFNSIKEITFSPENWMDGSQTYTIGVITANGHSLSSLKLDYEIVEFKTYIYDIFTDKNIYASYSLLENGKVNIRKIKFFP